MRLILWDIDGTLVRAGPIAREVFATAVEHAVGTAPGDHGVAMSGKTDPQIAVEIMQAMGMADLDGHVPAVLDRLAAGLADAAEQLRAGGRVLPGVPEVLARIDEHPGAVQTVLTGNIAANAAAKLAAFDLDRWLDLELGAFGSDHHDRCKLVPFALDRIRTRLRREPETMWVVGDTPNDLACARAGGARCLLVATGRLSYDELRAAGADAVLPDLSDVEAVADLLLT